MADETGRAAAGASPRRVHHFRRILAVWLPLSVAGDLLYWFLAGPHIPPGDMTTAASGAQFDWNVLFVCALPVVVGVWVYAAYALATWRESRVPGLPEAAGKPWVRGHAGVQVAWMTATTVLVMGLFVFGTVELVVPAGAGGAEGPTPIWTPSSKTILPIQVIGQQWKFTYRYPTFGGFETDELVVPDHTTIAFHVTSLDVIHDFWAYQLGVKIDANPLVDNVGYTTTRQLGSFVVRCDELCGLWHGSMYNYGRVVTKSAFARWARSTRAQLADNTKFLPPFAWTYTPDANGADGGFYPDNKDPYSPIETYGAEKVKVTTRGT